MRALAAILLIFAGGAGFTSWFGTAPALAQAACPVKIGGVMPLTGSFGPIAKPIASAAQLAVDDINKAGGVKGCPVELILRDDQGQSTVGVDAAKYLVEVERVQALTGSVSSGVTLPLLLTVAVPAKIPLVTCCATSETFTDLAQQGRTGGFFFRTLPTTKVQAYATASETAARGYKRVGMIFINNDFGKGLVKDYAIAAQKLGVSLVKSVAYNENQPSYAAEVNAVLAEKPDALFLASYPQDGAAITRTWISLGGTQNLILNNGLRSADYVKAVGSRFLQNAFGLDNASVAGPAVDAFKRAFQSAYNLSPDAPGTYNEYDAVVSLGLAMNMAPDLSGPAIRDSIRKIAEAGGTVVGTGPDELRRAFDLIGKGQPVRYSGATGPVVFDINGDVNGAALIWTVKGDTLETGRTLTIDDISALFKKIDG